MNCWNPVRPGERTWKTRLGAYMLMHVFLACPAMAHASAEETSEHAVDPVEGPDEEASAKPVHIHKKEDGCGHGGHHKVHTWSLIGARFSVVTVVGPKGSGTDGGRRVSVHPGVSAGYELQVIPDWLEIELTAGAHAYPKGALLPIDLLFKKPFHTHHRVTPYIAIGPSVEFIFAHTRNVYAGVGGRAGTYLWVTKHFGFDIEAGYNAVFEHGQVAHDIVAEVGPVVHF